MANLKFVKGSYKNNDAIDKTINYIFDNKKMPNRISGSVGTHVHNKDLIIKQFYKVQKIHRNLTGKRVIHFVLSFSIEEMEIISSHYQQIGYQLLDYFNDEYQIVFALHEKPNQFHIHFVMNPVNIYTGNKCRLQKKDFHQLWHLQAKIITDLTKSSQ